MASPLFAHPLFEYVDDFHGQAEILRRRRYGVIDVRGGRLHRITLRPFPKFVSWPDLTVFGARQHRNRRGDQCLLFYNQPRASSNYLALKYVVSYRDATLATFRGALQVMDAIAALKRSDAIVCDAANLRISDRLAVRWGWEHHCPARWHRNLIKRFYGTYPAIAAEVLGGESHEEYSTFTPLAPKFPDLQPVGAEVETADQLC